MRITRLFQRAGAIGAASVALFVSLMSGHVMASAQVNVYGVDTVRNADGHFEARYHFQRRFAANDPNYPGKVDYVSRKIKVPKRNNPMHWFKKNPMEAAAIAAVIGAGYVIDELTSQVSTVETFIPEYDYIYRTSSTAESYAYSATESCQAYASSRSYDQYVSNTETSCTIYHTWHQEEFTHPIHKIDCSSFGNCPPAEPKTVYEPVPYEDLWSVLNPVANSAPNTYLNPWVQDANGNPYVYPEVKAEQAKLAEGVAGAEPYPDAVTALDPLSGRGLDPAGNPTGDQSPTPDAPPRTDAPIDFPDDYAREETLNQQKEAVLEIKDFLKESFDQQPDIAKDNPADKLYEPLTDQFETLPDVPVGVPEVPDFGINSGGCQSITFNWRGASVVFPNGDQCAKLTSAQQILGWFIYVCTFFGCVYTILGARSLKA